MLRINLFREKKKYIFSQGITRISYTWITDGDNTSKIRSKLASNNDITQSNSTRKKKKIKIKRKIQQGNRKLTKRYNLVTLTGDS